MITFSLSADMHHWPVLRFTAALVVKQAFTDLITKRRILE